MAAAVSLYSFEELRQSEYLACSQAFKDSWSSPSISESSLPEELFCHEVAVDPEGTSTTESSPDNYFAALPSSGLDNSHSFRKSMDSFSVKLAYDDGSSLNDSSYDPSNLSNITSHSAAYGGIQTSVLFDDLIDTQAKFLSSQNLVSSPTSMTSSEISSRRRSSYLGSGGDLDAVRYSPLNPVASLPTQGGNSPCVVPSHGTRGNPAYSGHHSHSRTLSSASMHCSGEKSSGSLPARSASYTPSPLSMTHVPLPDSYSPSSSFEHSSNIIPPGQFISEPSEMFNPAASNTFYASSSDGHDNAACNDYVSETHSRSGSTVSQRLPLPSASDSDEVNMSHYHLLAHDVPLNHESCISPGALFGEPHLDQPLLSPVESLQESDHLEDTTGDHETRTLHVQANMGSGHSLSRGRPKKSRCSATESAVDGVTIEEGPVVVDVKTENLGEAISFEDSDEDWQEEVHSDGSNDSEFSPYDSRPRKARKTHNRRRSTTHIDSTYYPGRRPGRGGAFGGSAAQALRYMSEQHQSSSEDYYRSDIGNSRKRKRTDPSPIPLPIVIPNLTKTSRGRKVPTVAPGSTIEGACVFSENGLQSGAIVQRDGGRTVAKKEKSVARTFVCVVEGCGKCFLRSEHLKRHVRSIHTYEKPYVCPNANCGKKFSRRDNLAQHVRVHFPR